MTWSDPIVDEGRKVREAHAARFNYDLDAIFADLKEQERRSGRVFVSFEPERITLPLILPAQVTAGTSLPANEDLPSTPQQGQAMLP